MCEIFRVSRSAYYVWCQHSKESDVDEFRAFLDKRVKKYFEQNNGEYGAPRIWRKLRRLGIFYNIKTIAESLRRQGLRAKAGVKFRPKTTDSNHRLPVYENILMQDFKASRINEKWVGDFTYLDTSEGWLYLAVIIDLYSRKVVGWSMSEHMKKELVCDAFQNALNLRGNPAGVIMHTDRGSQYCSKKYRRLVKSSGSIGSMSAKGCCYDNAVAESFFHSLKVEVIHGRQFQTKAEMRSVVFRYIESRYNRSRMHSSCDYFSPDEFELRAA
jgi:transposase InsO family protein